MKSTLRAFVAVEISSFVRAKAQKALKPIMKSFPSVKWTGDENYHVTLKFLGSNVPVTELHRIIRGIENACKGIEQFDLSFRGLGAFPSSSNPRTLWIGVEDGVLELRRLANRVEEELEKLGFPGESREFAPHLTVGTVKKNGREKANRSSRDSDERTNETDEVFSSLARLLAENANTFFGVSSVDCVTLFSSELSESGSRYEPLAEIELAPLGTTREEESGFNPQDYDDPTHEIDAGAMAKHFPEKIDARFDVDALDEEVEAELRAICGDAFAKGRKSARPTNANRGKKDSAKRLGGGTSSMKGAAKATLRALDDLEIEELDDDEFEKALNRGGVPKKK